MIDGKLVANPTLTEEQPELQFDFKFGFFFPWTFRFLGALAAVGSVFLLINFNWLGLPLLFVGLLIIFSYEGAEVDHQKKVYKEYASWLVIKTGKWRTYDAIDKVYINKIHETQRMYSAHTSKSSIFSNAVYHGYLKFSSNEKILLLSKKNKANMVKRLEGFAKAVGVPLVDNT